MTTRGERWRDDVLGLYEMTSPADVLLVEEIAATIDAVDAAGSIVEARQQRVVLSRLLGQLNLPATGEPDALRTSYDGKSVRARRASQARWAREKGD